MSVPQEWIYAVHATTPTEVGVVEIVFINEQQARAYAADRSSDFGVLSASVTRYMVGEVGTRHAVAWYAGGAEQPMRAPRPGRIYPNGS